MEQQKLQIIVTGETPEHKQSIINLISQLATVLGAEVTQITTDQVDNSIETIAL